MSRSLAWRTCLALAAAAAVSACSAGSHSAGAPAADDASVTAADVPRAAPPDAAPPIPDALAADTVPLPDTAGDLGLPDAGPTVPPRICRPGATWSPGTPAFTDVTSEVGLWDGPTRVRGIRLSAADLDGDGTPELVTRMHVPGARDDFGPGGTRVTWVLRTVATPGGGFRFEDVTEASGLLTPRTGVGGRTTHIVIFGDVDNDGDLDAFTGVNVAPDGSSDNGDRSEIMLNRGDGTFALGPETSDVRHASERKTTSAAAFVDIDRDGLLDLFVGYDLDAADMPDRDGLYRGDGAGRMTDLSVAFGLETQDWLLFDDINHNRVHHRTWGVTACDLNDDGWPDLVGSSYGRFFNSLWLGGEEGGFPHVTEAGLERGVAADDNLDWTTNLNAQCYCKLQPTAAGCAGVPGPPAYFPCQPGQQLRWNHDLDREPFRLAGNTFSTVCADVDNDGDLDLMELQIVHWDVGPSSDPTQLLLNDGQASFTRPGVEAMGLVRDFGTVAWNAGDMTGAVFDFDNDGRKDIYIGSSDYPGTRGFLFHQSADGTFTEVAVADGIAHPRSHGIAVADFDRDGDLDVAVGHSRFRCQGATDPECYPTEEVHVFRNDVGNRNNWLQVALTGAAGANRSAIGARVTVRAGGVTQTQEVGGGHGHYGMQHGLVLHFGLGAACDVDEVRVTWPDAARTVQTFAGVRANYRVRLTQNQSEPEYVLPDATR